MVPSLTRLGMTLYASATSVERLCAKKIKEGTNIKKWFKIICVIEQNIIRLLKWRVKATLEVTKIIRTKEK